MAQKAAQKDLNNEQLKKMAADRVQQMKERILKNQAERNMQETQRLEAQKAAEGKNDRPVKETKPEPLKQIKAAAKPEPTKQPKAKPKEEQKETIAPTTKLSQLKSKLMLKKPSPLQGALQKL